MDAPRVILTASVATAVVVAWAFAAEVFAPPTVSMPEGDEVCLSSQNSRDYLVSVSFTNDGRDPVILRDTFAASLDDVSVTHTWVVSPEFSPGFAAVSYTPQAIEDWGLVDAAGTSVAPDESVDLVYRLVASSGRGRATDFTVDYTDRYGLHQRTSSPFAAGFYSGTAQPDSLAECD